MLIPLEISMSYPIKWTREKVARDFVQNFYDSIGFQDFHKDFCIREIDGDICMETFGRSFSFEWLIHIGASTKTDKEGEYIGQFGEGYKMCVLACMQNGWGKPVMESQNWRLTPCIYEEDVSDTKIKMLGYEKEEREDDGYTRLTLSRNQCWFDWKQLINEVKLEFFYEENPLFGKKVYESSELCIYERSSMEIPCNESVNEPFLGLLFCNYLARGRLPIKYILSLRGDMKKYDTRSRNTFLPSQVKHILIREMEEWKPEVCLMLLKIFKKYWSDMPKRTIDLHTWYYVICHLVRKVASDKNTGKIFLSEYKNLYYIDRKTGDRNENQIIRETEEWVKRNREKREIVNPIFRMLGAKSLVQEYREKQEITYDVPNKDETKRLNILFGALETVISFPIYDIRPSILIDRSAMKQDSRITMKRIHSKSDRRKYEIVEFIMHEQDIENMKFKRLFMKMATQIISIYGTWRCAFVNALLTELAGCIAKDSEYLAACEVEWDA